MTKTTASSVGFGFKFSDLNGIIIVVHFLSHILDKTAETTMQLKTDTVFYELRRKFFFFFSDGIILVGTKIVEVAWHINFLSSLRI